VQRLERYLMELGLINRTPSGRELTEKGEQRARRLRAEGKA
jgi:Holliday junction resolvasome RuvABC ATP-dependent DNA helicase subunit